MAKVVKGLVFNGHCKDHRIKRALILTNGTDAGIGSTIVQQMVAARLHPDKRAIKRYAQRIALTKIMHKKKVRVAES